MHFQLVPEQAEHPAIPVHGAGPVHGGYHQSDAHGADQE